MRGPSIDWGIILLNPGEMMAEVAHGHNFIDETFYFVEGSGFMIVDDKKIEAKQGDAFLLDPLEKHDIENPTDKPLKVLFIKTP